MSDDRFSHLFQDDVPANESDHVRLAEVGSRYRRAALRYPSLPEAQVFAQLAVAVAIERANELKRA